MQYNNINHNLSVYRFIDIKLSQRLPSKWHSLEVTITLYLGRFQGNALLKNCFEDKMHILVRSCIEHWPWSMIILFD